MFSLTSSLSFFLFARPTDMRKSFDALCGIISTQLSKNPLSCDVYIFINKTRNKIKLLYWESGGFVLYYKRLENGTLELPEAQSMGASVTITWPDLVLIIEGISLKNIHKPQRYPI